MTEHLTSAHLCDLAALYSLGALDEPDTFRFETHLLEGCRACDAELADNSSVVALLPFAAEPASPPPFLRERLLVETSRVSDRALADLATRGDWVPHATPGVETRVLWVDRETRAIVMLVKAGPGSRYPRHRHAGAEEMLMIYGDLAIGDRGYAGGDFIRSEPGSTHEPGRTDGGCMFLIRTSLDDEVLPEDADDESTRAVAP
jgi:hypothetical protein